MTELDFSSNRLQAVRPPRELAVAALGNDAASVSDDLMTKLSSFTYFVGPSKRSGYVAFSRELSLAIGHAATPRDAFKNCLLSTHKELKTRIDRGERLPREGDVNARFELVKRSLTAQR